MKKKSILSYICKSRKNKNNNNNNKLLQEIYEAKLQWESTREYFNYVSDPKLVEYAIYSEKAARMKYDYLIKKARDKDLKANDYAVITRIEA